MIKCYNKKGVTLGNCQYHTGVPGFWYSITSISASLTTLHTPAPVFSLHEWDIKGKIRSTLVSFMCEFHEEDQRERERERERLVGR